MKRTLSFGILLSNWIVGFFLFFLFPTDINNREGEFNKTTIQHVKGEILESFQTPESTSLEIEWKLQFFLHSTGWNTISDSSSYGHFLISAFTSLPLFDVKTLFIHFFHTW